MKALISLIVIVALAAAVWFGGQALGLFGGKSAKMTAEEIAATLSAHAAEINAAAGLKYDDFSQLMSAVHVEKQITIRANSLLKDADLPADYLESREAQAANFLCRDETTRKAIDSGASYIYNWFSADGTSIGMVSARGETWCADHGHAAS